MFKKALTVTVIALVVGAVGTWLLTPPTLAAPEKTPIAVDDTKESGLQPVNLPSPPPVPPAEVDEVFVQAQILNSNSARSVAFSPDGKTALSGSHDGTVKWWDLSTGRVLKSLDGHSYYVSSVAFSPEGKTALSGSEDNTVKWWDLSTGRVIKSLDDHSDHVRSVAFSPDGKTALSGSDDKTVKWWDLSKGWKWSDLLPSGRVIKSLEGHPSSVYSVAFSPDGKTALSGCDSGMDRYNNFKWWDLSTGRVIKSLRGHLWGML